MEGLMSLASKLEVAPTLSRLRVMQQMLIRHESSSPVVAARTGKAKRRSAKKVTAGPLKKVDVQTVYRGTLESLELTLSECQPHSTEVQIKDGKSTATDSSKNGSLGGNVCENIVENRELGMPNSQSTSACSQGDEVILPRRKDARSTLYTRKVKINNNVVKSVSLGFSEFQPYITHTEVASMSRREEVPDNVKSTATKRRTIWNNRKENVTADCQYQGTEGSDADLLHMQESSGNIKSAVSKKVRKVSENVLKRQQLGFSEYLQGSVQSEFAKEDVPSAVNTESIEGKSSKNEERVVVKNREMALSECHPYSALGKAANMSLGEERTFARISAVKGKDIVAEASSKWQPQSTQGEFSELHSVKKHSGKPIVMEETSVQWSRRVEGGLSSLSHVIETRSDVRSAYYNGSGNITLSDQSQSIEEEFSNMPQIEQKCASDKNSPVKRKNGTVCNDKGENKVMSESQSKRAQGELAGMPGVKEKSTITKRKKGAISGGGSENEARWSELNIQMLQSSLYQQLFGQDQATSGSSSNKVEQARQELEKHGLLNSEQTVVEDVSLRLPRLEGHNIEEHFRVIGERQSAPYRQLLLELSRGIPRPPDKWEFRPGWTRYELGADPQPVACPAENALVLDVEVCVSAGQTPTLASAASSQAWYGWVSPTLTEGATGAIQPRHYITGNLIPLEPTLDSTRARIVVGHNVSYDRARIKEQYQLLSTGTRFVDTMSLHVCVGGVTSYQRALLKAATKVSADQEDQHEWRKYASLNSLSEVHRLYCGAPLDKSSRDIFLTGTLVDIAEQFQQLMTYCAGDVLATHRILNKLLPLFLDRFPHPVTLAGMLELSIAYLPVNSNWERFISDAHQTYEDLDSEARFLLGRRADEACKLLHEEKFREDIWLWDQDWSVQNLQLRKSISKKKPDSESKQQKGNKKDSISSNESECTSDEKDKHSRLKNGPKYSEVQRKGKNKSNIMKQHEFQKSECSETKQGKRNKKAIISSDDEQNLNNKLAEDCKLKGEEANQRKESKNFNPLLAEVECLSDNEEEDRELKERFKYLEATRELLPARLPLLPGYPAWYRKLCRRPSEPDWVPGAQLISTSMQITPKLLSLTWESYPLHYIREHGWGFLVPFSESPDENCDKHNIPLKQLLERCPIANVKSPCATERESSDVLETLHRDVENKLSVPRRLKDVADALPKWYHGTGLWCNVEIGGCCWFFKLPHKDGVNNRVGNPLAKDFLNKFSENVLASTDEGAEKVLDIGRKLSYWRNNRERVEGQMVVWLGSQDLPWALRRTELKLGAILPQVVVCGTLTRRAVEPTWMTASNAQVGRVGSELRAMVQSPPGFSFVGADVDSQELWIASVIGDAHFAGMHGATPLGWMTLSGCKEDATDMHSITAKAIGISRDHAKVLNYARIYGAGQQFAERLLKQFNPSMSDAEARSKATKMFTLTKGRRVYRLKSEFRSVLEDRQYSTYDAKKVCVQHGKGLGEMFDAPQWVGGTESAMFNRLEEIANSQAPVTPFLECRLSRALERHGDEDDRFLPTRVNWVVQSGAVDFLHLMLVSMRWLRDSNTRFCLSFHDEVRYLVPSNQRYSAALALHATNLLVRAFCARRLGLHDLPRSVAFFTSVEVDGVLRKEAHHDCTTPSNPHGLHRGYGIPLGESLDIHQAIEKAGHILRAPRRSTH